jgi:hypothetical protein
MNCRRSSASRHESNRVRKRHQGNDFRIGSSGDLPEASGGVCLRQLSSGDRR